MCIACWVSVVGLINKKYIIKSEVQMFLVCGKTATFLISVLEINLMRLVLNKTLLVMVLGQ